MGGGQMKSDAKLLEALALLERGDWQQAHAIVQQHETQDAKSELAAARQTLDT
jgi:hypothetical protein